jgi:predicted outer membrane repeat protein
MNVHSTVGLWEHFSVINLLSINTECNFRDRNVTEYWLLKHVLVTENVEITVCGNKVEHQGGAMSTAAATLNHCPQGQVPHAHMHFYFDFVSAS